MQFSIGELRGLINEAIRKAYDILGVSSSASQGEIKKAYRQKALELHPDRNPGKDTTADAVKVNVAYGLLSDPGKRLNYDMMGDKTLGDAGGSGYSPPPRRDPPPPPRQEPQAKYRPGYSPPPKEKTPPPRNKRYFTFIGGSSRKFWEIELVGNLVWIRFGRIGSAGHKKQEGFWSPAEASSFYHKKIIEKLKKGYREQTSSGTGSSSSQPPPPSPKPKSSQQKPPRTTPPRASTKTTYKIYGRKGKAPAHTRYQGKVFGAGDDTKFKNGDRANVKLGTDGRLSVNMPGTNHTQFWTSESVDRINEMTMPSDLQKIIINNLTIRNLEAIEADLSPDYAGAMSDLPSDWDMDTPEWWVGELKNPTKTLPVGARAGWYVVQFDAYGDGHIEDGPFQTHEEAMDVATMTASEA